MPKYVAQRALALVKSEVTKPRVLILGVAYKPGVSDVRETPVTELYANLKASGAVIAWHDPLVLTWQDTEPVDLDWDCDVAILATNQPGIDIMKLLEKGIKILDCSNSSNKLIGIESL
jgi:UDP-N-acetyl-D-glucosamine dehydrogenase